MLTARRATALLVPICLLVACSGGGGTASLSTTPSVTGTQTAAASVAASPSTPADGTPVEVPSLSAAPSAEPSDDALPAFSCAFPVIGDGTVPRAQLTDVRVGAHDTYDRIVFEFDGGFPELAVEQVTPPLLADGSGGPIDVTGSAFLQVTLRGATKQTDTGAASYAGPTAFVPGFDRLAALVEGGDFEAVNTWYVGMSGDACVRGFTLDDPPRIVLDLEH